MVDAEYMIVPARLWPLFDELPAEAGPFMCARYGLTRCAPGARAGIVAVHGIGGLGHLGVQREADGLQKSSTETTRTAGAEAEHIITLIRSLQTRWRSYRLGGARVIVQARMRSISALVGGCLEALLKLRAGEPHISALSLIMGGGGGWYSGTAKIRRKRWNSAVTGVHR